MSIQNFLNNLPSFKRLQNEGGTMSSQFQIACRFGDVCAIFNYLLRIIAHLENDFKIEYILNLFNEPCSESAMLASITP